jgi:hypothetical protein
VIQHGSPHWIASELGCATGLPKKNYDTAEAPSRPESASALLWPGGGPYSGSVGNQGPQGRKTWKWWPEWILAELPSTIHW